MRLKEDLDKALVSVDKYLQMTVEIDNGTIAVYRKYQAKGE
jgi:hypothetical protein